MNKEIMSLLFMVILVFIPTYVFAVDYNITDVNIDAYLQEDGDVSVKERHTYAFSGEFGGIIREIIPKVGTKIVHLEAFEHNQPLVVEINETEYKIHRTGEDETIVVDLNYEIKNGIDVYADVAEFYWPFFDRRNESTYENLTINVYPPKSTTDVIAFGYDEAFMKEKVLEKGQVQYEMGTVPSGRNGDIRVAYDAKLFAVTSGTNLLMRAEIEAEKEQLLDEAITSAERRELLSSIGALIVSFFALLLLFIVMQAWLVAKGKKAALIREVGHSCALPDETLSLPTTIFYTNYRQLLPETISASLLDLVRKGHVKKHEDDRFTVINRKNLLKHEQALIEWLFDEMGSNGEFHFDDITVYLKNAKNHQIYELKKSKWQNAVRTEMKKARLYENKRTYRLTIGLISFLFIPLTILFALYDLVALALMSIFLFSGLLVFALAYRPKTWEGLKIVLEWKQFKETFPTMPESTWQTLSENDKMRAFIYGLGTNEKRVMKKSEILVNAFKTSPISQYDSSTAYSFDPTWIMVSGFATANFKQAERTTGAESSSGGSFGGGGSGVGGGGGGSGAF